MGRGRPVQSVPEDMLDIWTGACVRERIRLTANDCGGCPHYKTCQATADKLFGRVLFPFAIHGGHSRRAERARLT